MPSTTRIGIRALDPCGMDKEQTPLLLRALAGEPVDRPPVWFMRQAGRYLPEYRALRAEHDFLTLCHDPVMATEVTLQPLRRYPLDAGIVFSDILLPLASMGASLQFIPGRGPVIDNPVRSRADIEALRSFDPVRDLPAPLETLSMCAAQADVPVLGFAGAPFTMACYLVEGGGSRTWNATKSLMWADPDAFGVLLDRLADAVGDHLQAQIEAGAAAVQLFDTWAGALAPEDYRRWALPAAQRALARVQGAPRIYFTRDSAAFLPWLAETGADAIGLDWRIEIGAARSVLGSLPVQGNLDPSDAGRCGHVFNLGHGITPDTPMDGVATAIDAVRDWSWAAN